MKTKTIRYTLLILTLSLFLAASSSCSKEKSKKQNSTSTSDPLPSWNNGELKKAITTYIARITDTASLNFIPVEDRIAVFDNDGTLWPEQPLIQGEFIKYRIARMLKEKPELAKVQPFKAVVEKDHAYFEKGGLKTLAELIVVTSSDMLEGEFEAEVAEFMAQMVYPKYNLSIKNIAYKPQVELLRYLRNNGFKTFICTGGDIDFVRVVAPTLYGIPKEQVIGSAMKYTFIDQSGEIFRTKEMWRINDGETKPAGIQLHIGKRPVFACGNERSSGDIAMLKYSQFNKYLSFQLLVNHTDSIREFFYTEPDTASLKAAWKHKWHIVDMQKDWATVFGEN